MRHETRNVADVQQDGGKGVGHVVAVDFQDFEAMPFLAHNLQLLLEVRAVVNNDLDEYRIAIQRQVVGLLRVLELLPVPSGAEVLWFMRDDPNRGRRRCLQ
ncbi:hypothetical protein StoSoilB13_33070 (plasmid) [Arthrobacter sp. StoSoilB13]|nr:hypothetical protein StoSoilB13_33070 [Arthrobacter sp. StoSoilB13]